MNRLLLLLAACWAVSSSTALAQTFTLSGTLTDGDSNDAPAAGPFTMAFSIVDDVTTLWSETQTGVAVVDGVFVVEVGAVEPIDVDVPVGAVLVVVVEGDALSPIPLARLLGTPRAARAATATTASVATRVGGLLPDEIVTRQRLATAGQAALPLQAVPARPNGIDDGDTGTDVSVAADSGLTLAARSLALGTVNGTKIATGAVARANLAASSVPGTRVAAGAVRTEHVVDGSLVGADILGAVTAREVATTPIFQVTAPFCAQSAGALMRSGSCTSRATVSCSGAFPPEARSCDSNACLPSLAADASCRNTPIGEVVLP
jgi:hypothetical protein